MGFYYSFLQRWRMSGQQWFRNTSSVSTTGARMQALRPGVAAGGALTEETFTEMTIVRRGRVLSKGHPAGRAHLEFVSLWSCYSPGGVCRTRWKSPHTLAADAFGSLATAESRPTSKTSICRTRVGRGLWTVHWHQTQPTPPCPEDARGPRPLCTSSPPAEDLPQAIVTPLVPENAGSPRSSRRCRSSVPPHLAPIWCVPDARAHARSPRPLGACLLWVAPAVVTGLLLLLLLLLTRSSPTFRSGVLEPTVLLWAPSACS